VGLARGQGATNNPLAWSCPYTAANPNRAAVEGAGGKAIVMVALAAGHDPLPLTSRNLLKYGGPSMLRMSVVGD